MKLHFAEGGAFDDVEKLFNCNPFN